MGSPSPQSISFPLFLRPLRLSHLFRAGDARALCLLLLLFFLLRRLPGWLLRNRLACYRIRLMSRLSSHSSLLLSRLLFLPPSGHGSAKREGRDTHRRPHNIDREAREQSPQTARQPPRNPPRRVKGEEAPRRKHLSSSGTSRSRRLLWLPLLFLRLTISLRLRRCCLLMRLRLGLWWLWLRLPEPLLLQLPGHNARKGEARRRHLKLRLMLLLLLLLRCCRVAGEGGSPADGADGIVGEPVHEAVPVQAVPARKPLNAGARSQRAQADAAVVDYPAAGHVLYSCVREPRVYYVQRLPPPPPRSHCLVDLQQ